jgi:hypothetical protein
VNAIAGAEDEILHLGVPSSGLMTEVNTCFKQISN